MYFNNYNIAFSNEHKLLIEPTAYLKHLIAKGCSPKTINNNRVQLKKFYEYLEENKMSLEEIVYTYKPSLFHANYISFMREKNPDITNQSINVNLICCENYFSFLFINNYIGKELEGELKTIKSRTDFVEYTKASYDKKMSYAFERIKTDQKLFVAYDFDITTELLKIILGESLEYPRLNMKSKTFLNDYIKYRNAVVIQLMGTYAMRIGEVLGIHINADLDLLNENILFVNRRLNNSNGAIAKIRSREVTVNQRMIDRVYELAKVSNEYFHSDYLFLTTKGTPIFQKTYNNIFLKYKRILINKGLISENDKLSPHRLRHECLSVIYRKTQDLEAVKEIAGHKNISSSQIYVHQTRKEKMENIEKYVEINSGIHEEKEDLLLEDIVEGVQ